MSNIIKCKAAVSWGAGDKLKIEDVEVSPPKTGEVRVKVVASGLVSVEVISRNFKILQNGTAPPIYCLINLSSASQTSHLYLVK